MSDPDLQEPSLQERWAPDNRCFGCGPANPQGLRISSFVAGEGDEVVCDWTPAKHHESFENCLNGGVIGALFDCHGNWTAGWHLMQRDGLDRPPVTVTADFEVCMRRPTPTDGPVHIAAQVTASDGRKVEVEATLTAGGRITAAFCGHFVAVGRDHPAAARHGLGVWEAGQEPTPPAS